MGRRPGAGAGDVTGAAGGLRPAWSGILLLALFGAAASPAHAQFGRNKVQYRAFDFQIIRSDHFDLHYYPEEREAAMDAARMAERSYARLSRVLRHEFRERKPIIVYASHAHFQQTNALAGFIDEGTGGATEILKSRVILPFTGSYPDFDHVLTHELVHAFQFDVLFRSGVMTDRGPALPRIPLWFMEGMAEYLALGRIEPHTASWVRDAALRGYIRSIGEMNRRDDYLSYRFGQSLWAYIGDTWGDEVIGILLQKAPRVGVERAFASTLGVTLDELSAAWLRSVRGEHLPSLVRHGTPDDWAERLTDHEHLGDPWYLAPALSPDGDRLVFASQRDGFFMDLWLADGRTGEVLDRLVEGSRSAGFESLRYQSSAGAFSPDGSLVAFAAQTAGGDALYIYDIRKRRLRNRLTFDLAGLANPAWSPDGTRLVFTGLDGGISDLFVTDLDGRVTRLTRDRYADLQPAWSPDGRTIAFSSDRGPTARMDELRYGNFRVSLLDLATGAVRVLPHQDEGKSINPVWSPDGRELAWVGDRSGVNNLYLFDLRREELRQVTDLLTGIIGTNHLTPVLTWARQADRMVFVHFEGAGYNLYAVNRPRALPALRRWTTAAPLAAAAGPAFRDDAPDGDAPDGEAPDGEAPGGEAPADFLTVGDPDDGAEPASRPPASARASAEAPGTASGPAAPNGSASADGAAPTDGVAPADGAGPAEGAAPSLSEGREVVGVTGSFYRGADGLRASAEAPERTDPAAGPLSVGELLDSAELALPDTTAFERLDYRVRLTPDIVGRPSLGVQMGGYYGNGVYGGSYISLSDMLGNHNVVLAGNINGSLSDAVFYGGYGFYRSRTNVTLALRQMPFYRYRGYRSFPMEVEGEQRDVLANVFLRDVIRSADVSVSYPFSAFRRLELGGRVAHFSRDHLYRGYVVDLDRPIEHQERLGSMTFMEPSLAFVHDNTLFGYTGPVEGRRLRLQISHTAGDISFSEGLVDLRNYWNYDRWLILATRLVALTRTGPDSDRFSLYWGGPYFLRGYDGSSFPTSGVECATSRDAAVAGSPSLCPVRDQLIGSSAAFVNAEMRFPVITELRLGPLGQFPPVDGVVFFDAGLAWDERVCTSRDFDPTTACSGEVRDVHVVWEREPGMDPYYWRAPLRSWGVGLRLNVFYAILRLDYAFPLDRARRGLFSLAFGPSF